MLRHSKVINFKNFEFVKLWGGSVERMKEKVLVFSCSRPLQDYQEHFSGRCCLILQFSCARNLNLLKWKGDSVGR